MAMEPPHLRAGKLFHRQVQSDWEQTADGKITAEHTIPLLPRMNGSRRQRRGRLDIFVDLVGDFVTVVEIKGTQWDNIKSANVAKNLRSHTRQVWRYVEKFLDVDNLAVCAGVIYPYGPKDRALRQRIEAYLNDQGLQVVWYFE